MDRSAGNSVALKRRSVLAGMAATAVSAGLLPGSVGSARAQTIETGSAKISVVSDGSLTLPLGFVFPDAPQQDLEKLLIENGMATDALRPDCNVTLVNTGDRLAIFDVGAGPNFMATAGKLAESLAAAGVDPSEVTDVVITHAHPDHIWGLTDDFDELVFANAQHHISEAEWDFWSADDAISKVPEDRQTFVVGAQSRFAAMGDNVRFLKDGDAVLPGVEAVATPGHTPGHLSFMVHGAEPVLIVGDAITNSILSFVHPDWPMATDQDPDLAIKTRLSLLDRLATEKARAVGFHFPHPGAGMVEKKDGAYRYLPI